MAQEIDINLNVNAEQADKSLGSLKSQLREAQQDVQKLADKFGATSAEAVNAAKRAAELKDKIGDAKSLTEAFNPDAKFKALSASLSGVAGGFAAYQGAMGLVGVESKDLEKQLLKVQSAMAIAQGLQTLGEARDSFKQLKAVAVDALKGIKTEFLATGIGVFVVALGTIYAYWEDIKGAVSGVSEEQKKLIAASQKNADIESEKLKTINNQDNILKLQGKSEKEILDIKIKQTDEAIAASKINQENQLINNKLAVEGAKRNFDLLKSYIEFISTPVRTIYETYATVINKVIDLMNKIPGINIKYKVDEKLGNQAVDYLAKLAFDPDKVKKDGEATVKASQDTINKLLNDRAGYQLGKNAIDKKAAEDAILTEEEFRKKWKENSDKYNKELALEDPEAPDITGLENKAYIDAKYKEDELAREQAHQLAITQLQYDSQYEREEREDVARQRKILAFQESANAVADAAKSGEELLSSIQAAGLARGKAGQAAMKALALAQIGADTAIAISKAIPASTNAGLQAGLVAGPAAPVVTPKVTLATYIGLAAMIASNVARAKALLSGGGGGGGGAIGGGGGGAMSGGAAPSFNVVGPSGANQIAESIGARESQPLKAFVVGGDVSTQQGLNRSIVQNATLG
jgi:hypothetical protein